MLEFSIWLPVLHCCKGKVWKEMKIRVEGALPTDSLTSFCYFFTEDGGQSQMQKAGFKEK